MDQLCFCIFFLLCSVIIFVAAADEHEGLQQIRLNLQIPGLECFKTLTLGKKTHFLPKFEREVDNGKVSHEFKSRYESDIL